MFEFKGPLQYPDDHDIGVGVVVKPGFVAPWVAVVVFVGPHDAQDLVTVFLRIPAGDACPKPCDFKEHFTTVKGHELKVAGNLIVLPDVVGDGGVDMALETRIVGYPAPRFGVQVQLLCFLPAVAAALPWIHGAPMPGPAGRLSGSVEPSVAVH